MLDGLNIVVYDCEIKEEIDNKNVTWNDHDKMGISVACLYDYKDGDFKVYMDDNLPALVERLNSAALVVAFNQIGFDNKLVRANGLNLKPDSELPNYDMLDISRRALGWDETKRFPKGCRLDNHLESMFGDCFMKTSHGEEAPRMWKAGKLGELISYCLADVTREKTLFEFMWKYGYVRTTENGLKKVAHPLDYVRK